MRLVVGFEDNDSALIISILLLKLTDAFEPQFSRPHGPNKTSTSGCLLQPPHFIVDSHTTQVLTLHAKQ